MLLSAGGCGNLRISAPPAPALAEPVTETSGPMEQLVSSVRELAGQGHLSQALMLLSQGMQQFGPVPGLYLEKGAILERLGDRQEARLAYEAALLRAPSNMAALEALGVLHLQEGRIELARKLLSHAIELDKSRVRNSNATVDIDRESPVLAYNGMGIISDSDGEHERAADYFLSALQVTKSAQLYNNLGYSRFLAQNLGGAEWAYRQSLVLDPAYKPALQNLALLHGKKGNFQKALTILEQAEADWQAYGSLGAIARESGYPQWAFRLFSSAADRGGEENSFVQTQLKELQARFAVAEPVTSIRTVNAHALKIREAGSLEAAVIGWLVRGDSVAVIEESDEWALISTSVRHPNSAQEGWVYAAYLSEGS